MSDPYEILGLPPTATLEEIRQRYRQLAARYHPDHGVESWIFKQIRAAYEELCENLDPNRPSAGVDRPPDSAGTARSSGNPTPARPPDPSDQVSFGKALVMGAVGGLSVTLLVSFWRFLTQSCRIPGAVLVVAFVCLATTGIAFHALWHRLKTPEHRPVNMSVWPSLRAYGSLSLGLIGLASWMVPVYGWPVAITAYLCGYSSNTYSDRHLALIGMSLGIYSFVLTSCTFCYVASLPPSVTPSL